jgi:hypothetical protein
LTAVDSVFAMRREELNIRGSPFKRNPDPPILSIS